MKKYIYTLIGVCALITSYAQTVTPSTLNYNYDATTKTLDVTQTPTHANGGTIVAIAKDLGTIGDISHTKYTEVYGSVTDSFIFFTPNATGDVTTEIINSTLFLPQGASDIGVMNADKFTLYIDSATTINANNLAVFAAVDEIHFEGTINHTRTQSSSGRIFTIEQHEYVADYPMTGELNGTITLDMTQTSSLITHNCDVGIFYHTSDVSNLKMGGTFNVLTKETTNGNVYGVKGCQNVTLDMTGTMNINGSDNATYGIYAKQIVGTNDFTGTFNIEGQSATGIEAEKIAGVTIKDITVKATTGDAIGVRSTGDAEITMAEGTKISATNAAGDGLSFKVDGKLTLSGEGELVGNIEAGELNVEKPLSIKFTSQDAYIKANLSGSEAGNFVRDFYAIDPLSENALIGTYEKDATGQYIEGSIADGTFNKDSLKGEIIQGSNGILGWSITENTYLTDNVAKTDKEKAVAKLFDSAKSVDAGGVEDKKIAAMKKNAASKLSAYDMSAAAKMAEQQTQLAEDTYLNNFFQTYYSWTKIRRDRKAYKDLPAYYDTSSIDVTVRSINRFGTGGAESNTGEYDFTTFGAMANAEASYKNLLFGAGIGGWRSTVDYEPAGEAESNIIAATAYLDCRLTRDFDWYTQLYFGRGMNTLDQKAGGSTDWDSNVFGGFTALRYSFRVANNLVINPFAGVMVTYNMQDDVEDTTNHATAEMDSYVNIKGVIGVEAIWQATDKFFVTGRALYAREFGDTEYDMGITIAGLGKTSYKAHEATEDTFMVGVGVGYNITDNWSAGINYNAEVRTSELNHNFNFNVGYRF